MFKERTLAARPTLWVSYCTSLSEVYFSLDIMPLGLESIFAHAFFHVSCCVAFSDVATPQRADSQFRKTTVNLNRVSA